MCICKQAPTSSSLPSCCSFCFRKSLSLADVTSILDLLIVCTVLLCSCGRCLVAVACHLHVHLADSISKQVFLSLCEKLVSCLLPAKIKHLAVHVVQVLLLWSKDRAWPCNSDPTDEGLWWESKVLHAVEGDQRTSSTKTSLAMDRDGSVLSLSCGQELSDDLIRWGSSIQEVQIQVFYSVLDELLLVVLGLVETHNE